jgi:hypothetical protein
MSYFGPVIGGSGDYSKVSSAMGEEAGWEEMREKVEKNSLIGRSFSASGCNLAIHIRRSQNWNG